MVKVAEIGGVRVIFYANEHPPPHFHAQYNEHMAVIDIETLDVIRGFLPVAKRRALLAWAREHQAQLRNAFDVTVALGKVEPFECKNCRACLPRMSSFMAL